MPTGPETSAISHGTAPDTTGDTTGPASFVGMIKPSKRGKGSHDILIAMLPPDIRTAARYAPIENGTMDEFAAVIPAYAAMVAAFAGEGAQLIHAEGTPPFLILGYDEERRTVDAWEKAHGVPVFTSAMSQVDALRALGVRKLVDAGYDPTTGPIAERYFRAAGFDVLAVEKVPVDWGASGDISDEDAFTMLAGLVRRHPGADGLCLQGSSKWRLSVVERLERELGIAVVHPIAARYRDLLRRLGRAGQRQDESPESARREGARAGLGRLLAEMP